MRMTILAAAAAASVAFQAAAAPPPSTGSVLDAVLARLRTATGTAGIAAAITRDGVRVWSGAVGRSVVEQGRPFRHDTLSSVASVSKMVTATIVLRMVEDGLLPIDGPIAPYVPAEVPAARTVTIRDLLGMRSGYNDTEATPAFAAAASDPNHHWTRDELFGPLLPPHFPPGTQVEYNNTNYVLLSAIVDAAYPGGMGAAFEHYVRRPALLGSDVAFRREPRVADRFAHGYAVGLGGEVRDVSAGATHLGVNTSVWGTFWGDGGVGATAQGIARFGEALFAGALVRPATLGMMEAPLATSSQGLGLESARIDGHLWYGHAGAFNGYTAILLHDSVRDVTVAGVANTLNANGAQAVIVPALIAAYDAAAGD